MTDLPRRPEIDIPVVSPAIIDSAFRMLRMQFEAEADRVGVSERLAAYGIEQGNLPDELTEEQQMAVQEIYGSVTVEISGHLASTLVMALATLMPRVSGALAFARYLHENGHEALGNYLYKLASIPSDDDDDAES